MTRSAPDRPDPSNGIVVVVGNPRPSSRTGAAAIEVAERLAKLVDLTVDASGIVGEAAIDVIEVGPWATALVSDDDEAIEALRTRVLGARALVVASPTYKASYSGLLKLFLERFAAGELAAKPVVALMTGGSPAHSLVVTVHLTPVLEHLGASVPAAGIHLSGADADEPASAVDAWFKTWRPALTRALT